MDCFTGSDSVVRRRPKIQRSLSLNVKELIVIETDRQSICFSGGYLTLSPQKSNNSAGPVVRQKWRHSYACDGDIVNPSITNHDNKLYSIREEENYDVGTRSATLRAGSLTTLSSL